MYNLKIRLGDSVVCGVEVNASECHFLPAHETESVRTDSATGSSPAWRSRLEAAVHTYGGTCGTEGLLLAQEFAVSATVTGQLAP